MKKITVLFVFSALMSAFSIAQAQPVISAQPQSRTNNIADNARFTVTATGTGTLTYQWNFAGNPIENATASQLNLSVTNSSQAGAYTVVVNDDVGPSVESSGANLVVLYGNRLRITQWDFNSTVPNNNTADGVLTPSLGAGTATWPLMTLNNWLAGSSSDPASAGTDNSGRSLQGPTAARVNKTAGAQFAVSTIGYKNIAVTWEHLSNARACAYWRGQYSTNGTDWVDRVVVDKRTPFLALAASTYTFHHDDLTDVPGVKNNPSFAYRIVGEYESTATLSGSDAYVMTDPNDPGGYNNTGAHRWDMVTFLGTVDTSEEQPVILVHPQSQTATVGDNVTLNVSATGGSLVYYWRFESQVISVGTNSSMTLTNVQLTNSGNYSVIASNSAGTALSSNALLTVVEPLPPGERFWSANGSAAGGSGTWDNVTANRWGLAVEGPFDLKWNNTSLDSATFVADVTTPGAITVGSAITVNKMTVTNVSAGNYSFTGPNTITFSGDEDAGVSFAGTTGTATFNSLTMSCILAGPALTKTGGGRLNMNNTGNSVGRWIVKAGAITAANANQLAGTGNPATLVTNYFTLDGGGLGFAVGTASSISVGANRGIYLGPTSGNKLGCQDTGTVIFNGPITGPGSVSFPGFGSWPGQLQGSAATFVFSNPNNDYKGATTLSVGTLRCDAAEVLPNTTTFTVGGTTILNLNGFTQTVGNVIVNGSNARIQDTVGGASLVATNYDVRQGGAISAVLAGNATLTKTTGSSIQLNAANTYTGDTFLQAGLVSLNAAGRFGNGTGIVHLEGGGISFNDSKTGGDTLLNPVVLKAETIFQTGSAAATGDIFCILGGTWTSEGGKVFLWNTNTFAFELALTNALTLDHPIEFFGNPGRLTSFNPEGSDQVFNGGISGPGSFKRSVESGIGGRTVFTTENTYDGGTLIEAGTLLVNNPSGSGTGSGSVTVSAPGGVLGGTGSIAGNVVVNGGGSIAPGASAGILTLQNGLDMNSGGTMVWELAALKDNSNGEAGTDFDQLMLVGGELVLGGSSKLTLQFAVGTAPNSTIPFWQASRSWTIVGLNGGLNTANAAFGSIVNGSYGAGNFATAVSGGNIILTFTPGTPSQPSITSNPQSRTNIVGTTASFTVGATGSDPLTYAWFRSDAPFTPISGATNATFTIPNVQGSHAGSYFARVSNGLGTATSQTASLTIVPAPAIAPLSGAGTTNVVVSWNTIAGAEYELQYNTNLSILTWFPITNFVGTGGIFSVTNHPPVGDPQRYFRLVIE